MKRLGLAATLTTLAACTAAAATEPEYRALPIPQHAFAVPQGIFSEQMAGFPEGREGRQKLELDVEKLADGSYFVLLRRTGLLDDSVEGEERRAIMEWSGSGWRAVELGERWRCYRGRGSGKWTIERCA
ncbi:hypothetical protein [Allosphingosinicella sp.]|jgi:hypothetical protein|uniref:hypothetical protein n=1 Tax=Allosphingosinicella sp. TaxID=2823234 RepID=UPI002F1C43A2